MCQYVWILANEQRGEALLSDVTEMAFYCTGKETTLQAVGSMAPLTACSLSNRLMSITLSPNEKCLIFAFGVRSVFLGGTFPGSRRDDVVHGTSYIYTVFE
ncbi:UNVERIFIED_CONTAM: hypothetical protein FKN15_001057 [Acipenser sinensis]